MNDTLYARLGREDGITAAVTLFYQKVQEDRRVAHHFTQLAMDRQIEKQIAFMSYAFGAPTRYEGRDLRSAHRALRLTDRDFDAIIELLRETLADLHTEPDVQEEVLAIVESTRSNVLGTSPE